MNTLTPLPSDTGQNTPGTVCLANESRFNATHLSEPLTAYATGWRDPEQLSDLLDFLCPAVPVGRRFEFRQADNAEAFLSETDDVRSIGAAFKRVAYSGTSVQSKTLNKGLTIRVDHDEEVGSDWHERYVQILIQRLLRNELRRALNAFDSADTNANVAWNSSANPDKNLRDALKAATDASGVRPNRIVFGEGAWNLRADSYDAQDTAAAFRLGALEPDALAGKLLVDDIRILKARYQSSADAKTALLGNVVYCFYGQNGLLKDEPSNLKRFVTPHEGTPFRVYMESHSKYTDLSVEHYSQVVVTSSLGLRKLTVSAS